MTLISKAMASWSRARLLLPFAAVLLTACGSGAHAGNQLTPPVYVYHPAPTSALYGQGLAVHAVTGDWHTFYRTPSRHTTVSMVLAPGSHRFCATEPDPDHMQALLVYRGSLDDDGADVIGRTFRDASHMLAAAPDGTCYFVDYDGFLAVAGSDDDKARTVRIVGAPGFQWSSLQYAPATHSLVVAGVGYLAVVPGDFSGTTLKPVELEGTVRGIKFGGLKCCGKLSPDGRYYYSVIHGSDKDLNGFTAVGRFDVKTGAFDHAYLPYFFNGVNTYPKAAFNFDADDGVKPAPGDDGRLFLDETGQHLFVEAYYRTDQVSNLVSIDTDDGKITKLPIHPYSDFSVVGSGNKLYVLQRGGDELGRVYEGKLTPQQAGDAAKSSNPYVLFSASDGHFIRTLPGNADARILAVSPVITTRSHP